jgi:hypothetical protein
MGCVIITPVYSYGFSELSEGEGYIELQHERLIVTD